MSLAAVALLVAIISAVGTVANMAASWATFRRARPQLRVTAQWGHVGVGHFMDQLADGSLRSGLLVHVRNASPSEATVEHVHIVVRHPLKGGVLRGTHSRYTRPRAVFVTEEPKMTLSSWDGTRWELEDPRGEFPAWQFTGFRVRVTLTNGDQFTSRRWVSGRNAQRDDESNRRAIADFRKYNPGLVETVEHGEG